MTDTIDKAICQILLDQAGDWNLKQVTPATTVQALGIDSLDEVEIIMAIEERLNIELPDDIWANTQTVADLINNIKANMPEQVAHG